MHHICTKYSIDCGLPFCSTVQGRQTNFSIGLRVASVALGTISILAGILILLGIPGLSQLGTAVGWVLFSTGIVLALTGVSIKCIKIPSSSDIRIANSDYLFSAIQQGRSQEGCRGTVSVKRADEVREKLAAKAPPGISFDSSIYHQSPYIIGTCTCMSLELASNYFRLRTELKHLDPSSEQFLQALRQLRQNFEKSSEEMRSRQIAFSSITIDRDVNMEDVSKNKITSWVQYHDFETDYCSKELDIKENMDLLQQQINFLPLGVYFVRMHKPSDNHKLEAGGHSMIYVHEESVSFFYDNNYGLEKLSNSSLLAERLLSIHNEWVIPIVRLYQLKPN